MRSLTVIQLLKLSSKGLSLVVGFLDFETGLIPHLDNGLVVFREHVFDSVKNPSRILTSLVGLSFLCF